MSTEGLDTLLKLAEQLGDAMAQAPCTAALKKAQADVHADTDAMDLMTQYVQQTHKLQELQAANKPIEVADKHALADLEKKVSTNAQLKALTTAQMDFVDMTRKVKEKIDSKLQVDL